MQEKLENNRRILNNGTLRAGSNHMQVVDGKLTTSGFNPIYI